VKIPINNIAYLLQKNNCGPTLKLFQFKLIFVKHCQHNYACSKIENISLYDTTNLMAVIGLLRSSWWDILVREKISFRRVKYFLAFLLKSEFVFRLI